MTKWVSAPNYNYAFTLGFALILLFSFGLSIQTALADVVVDTIPFGNHMPHHIAVNPNTNKIYVSDTQYYVQGQNNPSPDRTVSIINGANNTVVHKNVGFVPGGIGIDPNSNRVYVVDNSNDYVVVFDGSTDETIGRIPSGGLVADAIAINTNTERIYVTNFYSDTVGVIDSSSNSLIGTISVGDGPIDIVVNVVTNKIYVANLFSDTISVIDGATNNVVGEIFLSGAPYGIDANPNTNKVYVAKSDGTVSSIDGSTDTVTDTIGVGPDPEGIAVNPVTNKIYVAVLKGDKIAVIDGATNTIPTSILYTGGPREVAVNTVTNTIYVTNLSGRSVTVIDGGNHPTTPPAPPQNLQATAASTSQIDLGWTASSHQGSPITGYQIERSANNGSTWNVLVSDTNSTSTGYSDTGLSKSTKYSYRVSAINSAGTGQPSNTASATTYTPSGVVVATIPVGNRPFHIAVNPSTDMAYVTNSESSSVSVIDGSTNEVVNTVPVGNDPNGIAVNPSTNLVYVASRWDNSISIIDGSTNEVTDTISKFTPHDIDVNPKTNMIYVTSWCCKSVTVINGSTNTVVAEVPIRGEGRYLAVNPNTNMVYATTYAYTEGSYLSIINATTNTKIKDIQFSSAGPSVAINADKNTIYVSDSGRLHIINGSTNERITSLRMSVHDVTTTLSTDRFFGSATWAHSVYVIDDETNSIIDSIPVGDSPWGMDSNPNKNKIYVANLKSNTVSVIDTSSSSTKTAPSEPKNLQAIAGDSKIFLSWNFPSSNGGSAITTYNIYRSTTSGAKTSLASAGNVTSYTDSTVTNNQTYFYHVTAVNSAGESTPSNEASATPASSKTAPDAPSNLSATTVSSSQIDLSWTTPQNDGGSSTTGYQIDRSTNNGTTWAVLVQNTNSSSTTYSDTGLSSSTSYSYRVSAINSVGTSDPSNTASATTSAPPPPPKTTATLTVKSADVSGNAFEGMWVELWQDSQLLQTGFTPFTAQIDTNTQYAVDVADYQDKVFDHWDDSSTSSARTFSVTQDDAFTAFYQTGTTTQQNNPPVASDDSTQTDANTPVTIPVLSNDSDPDGDTLSVTSTSAPSNGMATINSDNTITYSPNTDYAGTDSFTYTISDGMGGTDTALVSITINDATPPPANTEAVLTITSADMSGNEMTGMYAEIWDGSTLVKSGYTPLFHTIQTQKQYMITVGDWGEDTFDHWEDGSTIRERTISISQDTTVTAFYKKTTSSGILGIS